MMLMSVLNIPKILFLSTLSLAMVPVVEWSPRGHLHSEQHFDPYSCVTVPTGTKQKI